MHPGKVYVLYRFGQNFCMALLATTYVLLLLSMGLALSSIAALNLIFWVTVSLAELPTGMMADGKSRAWSIKTGLLMFFFGKALYAAATGLGGAVMAELTIGIGFAFISGADQAWLTDALINRGEKHDLKRWLANGSMVQAVAGLTGGATGALIGHFSLRGSMISAASLAGLTYLVCRHLINEEGEPQERLTEWTALGQSWRALGLSYGLKWSVAAAMVFGLVLPFNYYWTPFFKFRVSQLGLALVWLVIYGSMTVSSWLVRRCSWGDNREAAGVLVGLLTAGLGLATAGSLSGFFGPLMAAAMHEFGRGIYQPFIGVFTQRRVSSGYRATFGSLQSLLARVGFAAILLVLWLATRNQATTDWLIALIWQVSGVLMAVATLAMLLSRPRHEVLSETLPD